MPALVYHPQGTCSKEMRITYEDGIITDLQVIGGCNGNLKGVAALVKGRKIDDVISCLKGITCGFKKTSCPDQVAHALETIK